MATTTSNTNQLTNTPQAGDDYYGWTEDQLLASGLLHGNVVTLNVMANDLGGNAKKLWSIDDGNGNTNVADYDLVASDMQGVWENAATNNLGVADKITISNGAVLLDFGASLAKLGALNVDTLAAGDHIHDVFVYAIRLANGALSQATVTVDIWGENDAATISGNSTGNVTEDMTLTATGTLTVTDPDHGQSHTQTATNAASDHGLGTYSVDSDGHWSYTVNNALVQYLAAGQTTTDSFTVSSLDGTATQTVTVTITGSNDNATITASASEDTAVLEAGGVANGTAGDASASGQLTVHDVDSGENHFQTPASLAGTYGTYSFNPATGVWGYTLDQSLADPLTAGQVVHDHLTVTSVDGTATHDIDVAITGSNDNATITASASEDTAVLEAGGVANGTAGDASASGQLTVHDVDSGENHFQTPASLAGTYGTYSFNPATGVWGYTLDQSLADPLTAGQVVHDHLTVTSVDGTATHDIDVAITGSNDNATITASASEDTAVLEAGGVANGTAGDASASGQLTVHDVDSGENHFQTPASLAGTYGTYSFNPATGVWGYTLDQSLADPLTAGQVVHDHLTVTSVDGTATHDIDVAITGSNDNATITASASEDTAVLEAGGVANGTAGDASASGQLTVHDVDSGENHFQTPASLAGTYGTYSFNPATGVWGYTLDQSLADPLTAGQVVHDHLTVTSVDGTATHDIDVAITGSNDNATITASASEDTAVLEAGGVANGTAGDASASGQLTVHDVDSGENHFQTPASLAGTYGTYSFNPATGVWGYTLDQSLADPLTAGQVVHDHLTVTSVDGTATHDIDVAITGSNDNATITASASEDTAVLEAGGVANGTAGDASASGQLTVHDVDSGENHFQTPASLAGTYGTYSFNPATGVWGYTLDQSLADPLTAGQVVHDHLTVTSVDGTATHDIDVAITGSNDNATITASASEDTAVLEAGGVANGTAGDASASGQLTVHDVDSGENHFQTPASLAGTYGTYSFNPATGVWGYTLDQSLADPLTAGQVVHDHLTVTSVDGTATHDIDVAITGSNDNATITASASEDTAVLEAGGVANGTAGDASASGQLTVHDVDSGENHFQTPASLAGTYGTYSFNPATGVWGYTLDQSLADPLTAGQVVHDHLTVTSVDGTATHDIDVAITGSNDNATITASASEDTAVLEAGGVANGTAGDASASGQLTVHDVDSGENHFQTPASLAGTYGTYSFNPATGVWGYTLDQSLADPLTTGQVVHDHLTVTSVDGTATHDIDVAITGSNDAPVAQAISRTAGEDGPAVTLTALYTDVDASDTHSFSVNTASTHGLVTNNGDGTFSYNPNGQFETLAFGSTATDSFSYTVADNHGASSTETATVTITQPDYAATAVNDSYTVSENTTFTTTAASGVLANDTGADADGLNAALQTGVLHGSLTLNADGSFSYTPTAGYLGPDSFTYDAIGDGISNLATVNLTVADTTPPTGVDFNLDIASLSTLDTGSGLKATTSMGTFVANGDPDSSTFTYSLSGANAGLFTMTSAGHLSTGGSLVGPGTYSINVTATDQAANASSPVPVTIFVDASGANSITLSGSTNIAYGLNGSDTIIGTSGFDAISGGNNNDRIIGGGSGDYLSGGNSADTFQYNAITDSTPGIVNNKANYDTIADFVATGGNHDMIDFTNIAGINTSGGVPTFQGNITGAGNLILNAHSVAYIETGGNTGVLVNTTNSNETVTISDVSAANMEIALTGVSLGLTSADFHHV